MSAGRPLAVLGAGPVGLEAAARGVAAGWKVRVLEAGEPGEHLRHWGHVRLFTPFGMNAGRAGRVLLGRTGNALPADEALLGGSEFRRSYLLPLARAVAEGAKVETGTRVVAVTRTRLLKGEALGREWRAADPFRILVETAGVEAEREAEVVLDCTGTYGRPNWLGPGGAPARGERALRGRIEYGLPDVLGRERERYAGRTTLVVGGGHSAATTVLALLALMELPDAASGTGVVWLTRRAAGSLPVVTDDPLPARADLVERANALADRPPRGLAWHGGASIVAIEPRGERLAVTWERSAVLPATGEPEPRGRTTERIEVDRLVANVGHEPDDRIYRQLQVHECYASRAPMKLAAALLGASDEGPADCLELGGFGPEVLRTPEPGFFILGIKSYGRNSAFLLRTGYEQVEDVFSLLGEPRAAAATG